MTPVRDVTRGVDDVTCGDEWDDRCLVFVLVLLYEGGGDSVCAHHGCSGL